jgi:hypothetical protein
MKKIIILILLILVVAKAFGQETGNDSYTIQRLIIFNEKGEVLLQKHRNGWTTPALRHNTETTINEGLANLARDFGLEISTPQLHGNFMFFHSDNKKPSFRQHYTCKITGGEVQKADDILDVQWFAKRIAVQKMLEPDAIIVPAVGEMTAHILKYPKIIWGGSYLLVKEEGKKTQSEIVENFYPIGSIE